MIEKHTFVDTLNALKSHWNGQKQLEKALNCYFEDNNFIFRLGCSLIDILTDAFFTAEQLETIQSSVSKWGRVYHLKDTPDFVYQWETISDLLNHYCWNGDFGDNPDILKDRMQIKDKDGNIVVSYNACNAEELYVLIMDYITGKNIDEHRTVTIYCTT